MSDYSSKPKDALIIELQKLQSENATLKAQIGVALNKKETSLSSPSNDLHANEDSNLNKETLLTHYDMGLVGMAMINMDKGWLTYNNRFCEMLGYSQQELVGMKWPDFTHPDDIDENKIVFEQLIAGEIDHYRLNKRYLRKDGTTIHATIYTKGIRNQRNELISIVTHIVDVTEQVMAEEESRWNLKVNMSLARLYAPLVAPSTSLRTASEAILEEARSLTESEHGYACTINPEGAAIQAFSDMMGQCNVVSPHDNLVFPKNDEGLYPSLWGHALNSRKPFLTNSPQSHPTSQGVPEGHIPIRNLLSVPVVLEGELAGQISVCNKKSDYNSRDLDVLMRLGAYFALSIQRVKAKEEILSSKNLMEKILEGIKAGIMVIDPKTKRIESINSIGLEMLNSTEDMIIGKTCDIFCWKDKNGETIKGCPAKTNNVRDLELRMYRPDNEILPVSKTVILEMIDGKPKFIEILFDITKRYEMERQLALAQKLESIGQLSAGIAHEINTPAQYLGDNIKFFASSFEEILQLSTKYHQCSKDEHVRASNPERCDSLDTAWDDIDMDYLSEEIPKALSQCEEGIQRIISIVKAMKRFSHPGIDHMQVSDINEALRNTVTVCRNEWKYYANVSFDLDETLPPVAVYLNDLNQVFLNLVVNAAHAIADKVKGTELRGEIIIRTSKEDDQVVIEISDTGIGIPDSIMPKIFDPFFTTKDVGEGTGQGLSLCHSIIVNKHGGTIELNSKTNEGAKCTIKLPMGEYGDTNA